MPILSALFLLLVALAQGSAAELQSVEADGAAFKVTMSDGKVLRSPDLVGATLTIATAGGTLRVRIDAVERDPDAVKGEVWLHTFSTQAANGSWHNMCNPGPDGRRQGFPIAGQTSSFLIHYSENIL